MPMIAAAAASAFAAVSSVAATVSAAVAASTVLSTAMTVIKVLSVASSIYSLTRKPKSGMGSPSPVAFKADPNAPITFVAGVAGVGGNMLFGQTHAPKNRFLTYITALSHGGPVQSVQAGFTAGDEIVTFGSDNGEGASGRYQDRMWQKFAVGAVGAAALMMTSTATKYTPARAGPLTEWTAQHKLSGLAHTMWTMWSDTERLPNGVPKPLWIVHGGAVYDPRKDSTYPGGAGPQRWNDRTTWSFEGNENPQLHALTFLIGHFYNGKKVGGCGIPLEQIDVASFVQGANVSEANNWRLSYPWTTAMRKWDVLTTMLQAGGARPIARGAKISCVTNTPRVSLATIGEGDLVGDFSVTGSQRVRDRINTVIPRCRLPSLKWTVQPFGKVTGAVYVAEDGGKVKPRELEYEGVKGDDGGTQVRQLAAYDLTALREGLVATLPLTAKWLRLRAGDCITVDAPETLMNGQKVVIIKRDFDPATAIVTVTVQSETDGKHAFALGQTDAPPPTPALTGVDPLVLEPPAPDAWVTEPRTSAGGGDPGAGGTAPVIIVRPGGGDQDGTYDEPSATEVLIRYRRNGNDPVTGQPYPWGAILTFPPAAEGYEITGLSPGITYRLEIAYKARGITSDWTDYGTVTVPDLVATDTHAVGGTPAPEILADLAAVPGQIAAAVSALDAAVAVTIGNINASLAALDSGLDALDGEVTALSGSVATQFAAVNLAASNLNAAVAALDGEVAAGFAATDLAVGNLNTALATLGGQVTDGFEAVNDALDAIEYDIDDPGTGIRARVGAVETVAADAASRVSVVESAVNTPTTGILARTASLETATTNLQTGKADASRVTTLESQVQNPTTGLLQRASSLESRTTAVETGKASAARVDALESQVQNPTTGLLQRATSLESRTTAVETGKAAATRVDALEATVNTPTTGLTARTGSLETVTANLATGKAEASRVTALEAASNTPNLLPRSDFGDSLTAPWAIGSSDGNAVFELRQDGVWNMPGEPVLEIRQLNEAQGGFYAWTANIENVRAGQRYCASIYVGAHRCTVEVFWLAYNAAGTVLAQSWEGGPGTEYSARQAIGSPFGGVSLDSFGRIWSFMTAPAGTTRAVFYVRKAATNIGGTNSFMFAVRPMFSEATALAQTPAPWSPGSQLSRVRTVETATVNLQTGKADASRVTTLESQVQDGTTGLLQRATSLETRTTAVESGKASSARVDALESSVNNPTTGLLQRATSLESRTTAVETGKAAATRVDALEATVNTPTTGITARTASLETVTANLASGKADASRVTALEVRARGGNDQPDSTFAAFKALGLSYTSASSSGAYTVSMNNPAYSSATQNVLQIHDTSGEATGVIDLYGPWIPSKAGARYEFAAALAPHRCYGQIYMAFANRAYAVIDGTVTLTGGTDNGGGQGEDMARVGGISSVTPVGTAYRRVVIRLGRNGGGDPYLFVKQPQTVEATTAQTELSPYTDGPTVDISSRVFSLETATADLASGKASASRVDALESQVQNPTTGLLQRASSLESRTTAVENGKASASSVSALEATVNTPVSGLTARATSLEGRVSSVETNKASASSVSALEASVNTPTTGLLARAASLETVTANLATGKADASRVAALEATASAPNLLRRADFSDGVTAPWSYDTNLPGVTVGSLRSTTDWALPGEPGLEIVQQNTTDGFFAWAIDVPNLKEGLRYCASVYAGAHRCRVEVFWIAYNAAGAIIAESWQGGAGTEYSSANNNDGPKGGAALASFQRIWSFMTAPAGTVRGRLYLKKHTTNAGQVDSYMFTERPMFSEVGALAQTPPAWSAGSMNARIGSLETVTADLQTGKASASSVSALETTVNTPGTGLSARALSLEGRMSTVESGKASASSVSALESTVNTPVSGLTARATSLEGRMTTVETDKAAASRVTTLESQVQNPTTGLLARASTLETTTANLATGKAEASRLTALEAVSEMTLPHPVASHDFRTGLEGFYASGAYWVWYSTGPEMASTNYDSNLFSPTYADGIDGSKYPVVAIEVENVGTVPLDELIMFYATTGHGYSGAYYGIPSDPTPVPPGGRRVLFYDMRRQAIGAGDWIASTITNLRFDFTNSNIGYLKVRRVQVLGPNGGSLHARLNTVESVTTNLQTGKADASRVTTLESQSVSPNLLPRADFADLKTAPWATGMSDGNATATLRATNDWNMPGEPGLEINQLNEAQGGFYAWTCPVENIKAGARYCASIYAGAHRCDVEIFWLAYNAAGTILAESWQGGAGTEYSDRLISGTPSGGTSLASFRRIWSFMTAPAGTTRAVFYIRKAATHPGGVNSFMFTEHPMFAEATPLSREPGPWSAGSQIARVVATENTVSDLYGRTLARWAVGTAVPGADAFIEARAETTPGSPPTSSVAIGAKVVAIYNQTGGDWKKALEVVGGNVLLTGGLQAGAFIRLGTGAGWPVALRAVDFNAADGGAVSFGTDLGALPGITFAMNNLDPLGAGETYDVRASGLTATGFTLYAKIVVPGTPSTFDYTASSGTSDFGSGGLFIGKAGVANASDGSYRVVASGTNHHAFIGKPFGSPDSPDDIDYVQGEIEVWALKGGSWVYVASIYSQSSVDIRTGTGFHNVSGYWSIDETVSMGDSVSAVGLRHATPDAYAYMTGFSHLIWTAPGTASSTRSATPSGQTTRITVRPS